MWPDAFYAEMQDEWTYEEECAGAGAEAEFNQE